MNAIAPRDFPVIHRDALLLCSILRHAVRGISLIRIGSIGHSTMELPQTLRMLDSAVISLGGSSATRVPQGPPPSPGMPIDARQPVFMIPSGHTEAALPRRPASVCSGASPATAVQHRVRRIRRPFRAPRPTATTTSST